MSLNINGERLLAEALADAMDRDLADVPAEEQLKKQHRFSGKFVRGIKQIEKGSKTGNGTRPETGGTARDRAKKRTGDGKERPHDFTKRGTRVRRYGGMAAAFVCIAGLAALLGVMGRMGASKSDEGAFPEDMPQWEDAQDDASAESGGLTEAAEDAPADEDAGIPENEAEAPASGEAEENADFAGEPMAPDWQEQLLAESKEADALISWHLTAVYDGLSFVLDSELAGIEEAGIPPAPLVSASLIYEVYYQESAEEWVRVYHTDRSMSRCEPGTVWGDEYVMQDLNMTKPGTYRVVRQVNSYRQVLELTLEQT